MESKKILPIEERLRQIDLIADIVDIDYCVKYHKALHAAEAEIEKLENNLKFISDVANNRESALMKSEAKVYELQEKLKELENQLK